MEGIICPGSNIERNVKVLTNAIVYPGATIGANTIIDVGAIIYPGSVIGSNCHIGPYCIIGSPTADYYNDMENHQFKKTEIGDNSVLRSNTTVYEDTTIGSDFQTGHHVTIREKAVIGHHCSVGTFSDIQGKCTIGNFVRMHSNVHISQLTTVEDYVWLFPYVMTTNDMYPPHDKLTGCTIKEYALVGASTVLIPGVTIGRNTLIGAGSLVSKDIEDNSFAFGRPAVKKKEITEVRDKEGNPLYPWKEYLEENRGYPWQVDKQRSL